MPSRQKGLTLIEMMVAMAISLVIVIAAAYVYLGSRESQRALIAAAIVRKPVHLFYK